MRGLRVGGAGATLWQLCERAGIMRRVATACVASRASWARRWRRLGGLISPWCLFYGSGMLSAACAFLVTIWVWSGFCGAQGRLRRACAQAVLEPQLALAGWQVSWSAVRRRLNMAADAEATEGI